MIEIKLKSFLDLLRTNGFSRAIFNHDGVEVHLDLDKLSMVYDRQKIGLEKQEWGFGGYRYYLLCPDCGERRMSLYWRTGDVSCRVCADLHKRTLNRSKTDCIYYWEQSTKEAKKIDPNWVVEDYITPKFPDRPKGMHWTTYNKHYIKYMRYWNKALDLWYKGLKL